MGAGSCCGLPPRGPGVGCLRRGAGRVVGVDFAGNLGIEDGEVELVPRVCEALGERFKIVTGDAGLCARENADLVAEFGRWYLFALKGNQPHLYGLASGFRCCEMGVPR